MFRTLFSEKGLACKTGYDQLFFIVPFIEIQHDRAQYLRNTMAVIY